MEKVWKRYGIHVEKPWNPSTKSMESIPHSMESIPPFHGIHLEFLQSIPPSMDSTWNNPGRVKYCANWASVLHTTCYKALFGIVCDICSKNWPDPTSKDICTCYFSTILPSVNEGFSQDGHAFMEGIVAHSLMGFLTEAAEFAHRQVADQNCCMRACLSLNFFADISDC